MDVMERMEFLFDDLLMQTIKYNLTHEQLESNIRVDGFQQVQEWKSMYGYKFNIYSNDHLIDGKRHFHFDNNAANVRCKVDFEGNILEEKGNPIPANVLKEMKYFVAQKFIRKKLDEMWEDLNPGV